MDGFTFALNDYSKDYDKLLCEKYHNYQLINTILVDYKDLKCLEVRTCEGVLSNVYVLLASDKDIRILNSFYLTLNTGELQAVCHYIFERYKVPKIIWWGQTNALPTDEVTFCFMSSSKIEDNIAQLPSSFAEYISSLGKQTKKHSKYYMGRLVRDFPSTSYEFIHGNTLSEDDLAVICKFSSERIENKSLKYINDTELLKKRIKHDSAFAFVVKIENQIQAGCLGYILGEHLYLSKISHNILFNRYNLGNVVLLKLIEYCIEHNVKYFHFLWGRNVDYKERFGGVTTPLTDYVFYNHKDMAFYIDKFILSITDIIRIVVNRLKKNDFILKSYRKVRYFLTKLS